MGNEQGSLRRVAVKTKKQKGWVNHNCSRCAGISRSSKRKMDFFDQYVGDNLPVGVCRCSGWLGRAPSEWKSCLGRGLARISHVEFRNGRRIRCLGVYVEHESEGKFVLRGSKTRHTPLGKDAADRFTKWFDEAYAKGPKFSIYIDLMELVASTDEVESFWCKQPSHKPGRHSEVTEHRLRSRCPLLQVPSVFKVDSEGHLSCALYVTGH